MNKNYLWLALLVAASPFLIASYAHAAVIGTSTAMTSNSANTLRANTQAPVLMLNLSNSSSETMGSVTVTIATTTSATSTALSTSSFSFIGVARDASGSMMLATTTVTGISTSTTINIAAATTTPASGNFFVILGTAGTSTFTDNGWPENASATPQRFVVTVSTSTGVVASSTNASLTGASTTAPFAADIHSQAPNVARIGTSYNASTNAYSVFDVNSGGGVDEMGTLNAYNFATSTSPIATTTVNSSGQMMINLGATYLPSLWLDLNDVAGNVTSSRVQFNLSNFKPTVTSFFAFTDRIVLNLSGSVRGNQATNCANYQVNGSPLACGGGPSAPYINFFGNQIIIRNLSLSGTVNFTITGLIEDSASDQFPLNYSTSSAPVAATPVPTVSQLAPNAGAAGTTVTITGTNFGAGTGTVYFSGGFSPQNGPLPPIAASTTAWSNTSITATVPTGAQGGPVQVAAASGVSSDPSQSTFFQTFGNIYFEVALATSSSPITTSTNMQIFVGDPSGGMHVFYNGDASSTSFSTSTYVYTIPNAPLMGFAWAYDSSGANLPAPGMQFQGTSSSTPQVLILASSTPYKVSGTITLGTSCLAGYQGQLVAAMALPQSTSINVGSGGVQPSMFLTNNGSCQAPYVVALPGPGTYNVQAMLPPGTTATGLLSPPGQTISVTTSTQTATANFNFTSANYSIYGQIVGANGSALPANQYNNLMVFGYQPTVGGQSTVAQPNSSGYFRLYTTPGSYKISVGGPQMPSVIEQNILVTTSSAFAANVSTPVITLTLSPPTSYIQGYVKDGSGNAISGTDVFSYCANGPGGGHGATDSQGFYKMYVPPCASYTVNGFSSTYGQLTAQSNVSVSNGGSATVNFTVNTSNLVTVSGSVSQNGSPVAGANVWITQGSFGQGVAGGQTGANGAFSLMLPSGLSNLYLNAGTMGQGQLGSQVLAGGGTVSSNQVGVNVSSSVATLTIRLSPGNTFTQAFLNAQSGIGNGFSNTAVATSSSYDTYQIQVPYAGGGTVYTVGGGIPNFGPIPNSTTTVSGNATIAVNLSSVNFYAVSGSVSGDYNGGYVWAGGSSGGGGTQVASDGTFSMKLRQGTYDIGVNKPGDIGSFLAQQNIATTTSGLSLTLTQVTSTISGTASYSGTAVSGVRVWADNASGGWAGGQTDANGNFSLSVSPGAWRVHAVADGYQLTNPLIVTAPASGLTLALSSVNFTPTQQVQSMNPSTGGIIQTTSTEVQIPQGALGSGSTNVQLSVTNTMSTPQKKGAVVVGTGENISATYASGANQGQAISTLSQNATLSFVLTKAQLVSGGVTSLAQAQQMQIGYDDPTSNTWTYIPTTVTVNSSDGTWANLISITLSGTTGHFSTYAPVLPTNANAPATPGGVAASAGNGQVTVSWTAVSGATNYNIYRQSGSNYVYLAQTASTSYVDSGLSNGTSYSYEVTSLDNSNNESAASGPVSATPAAPSSPGGGGGGGAAAAPYFTINSGALTTSNPAVELEMHVTIDVHTMAFATSSSNLTSSTAVPYASTFPWNLCGTSSCPAGSYAVYATFFTTPGGVSYNAQQTIILTGATTTGSTAVPASSSVGTAAAGATQIQTLQVQLATLMATLRSLIAQAKQLGIQIPSAAEQLVSGTQAGAYSFAHDLRIGSRADDVKSLQSFLIANNSGPMAQKLAAFGATGRFLLLTKKALQEFQKSVGITPASGYFGPKTRAYINSLSHL